MGGQEYCDNGKISSGNNDKGEPVKVEDPQLNHIQLIALKKSFAVLGKIDSGDFFYLFFLAVTHLPCFSFATHLKGRNNEAP